MRARPAPLHAAPTLAVLVGALLAGCAGSGGGDHVVVTVSPPVATVPETMSQQFLGTMNGAAIASVTWSVTAADGGAVGAEGGAVSAGGLYTAPGAPGSFRVVATSVADTSKSGAATVTVVAPACGAIGQPCCGSGAACSAGTCVAGTCVAAGGTHVEHAVDPVAQAPNGLELNVVDQSSTARLLQDRNPARAGDLFGIVEAGRGIYYLLTSADAGQSWTYLTATGARKPAGALLGSAAVVQDTVGYQVHWVTFPYYGANALYHRVTLAYDTSGHVNGWSWDVADLPGPAFASAGVRDPFPKLDLIEVVDGSGVHLLALAGMDMPSSGPFRRLVAARTRAGTASLAPTSTADWGRITDGAGTFSVLGAWFSGAAGTDGWVNYGSTDAIYDSHISSLCLSQSAADGALHVFAGSFFYNDTDGIGDIRRWRLTRGSGAWAPGTSGAAVGTTDGSYRPCTGNCVGAASSAWFTWGDVNGLHIGRVDQSGTWQADAVASPDPSPGNYWYASIGVAADEAQVWAIWERNPGNRDATEHAGYWNGAAWTTQDDTTSWRRNPGFKLGADWAGAAAWAPIGGLVNGVGAMAYGYGDWGGLGQDEYSIHVYR